MTQIAVFRLPAARLPVPEVGLEAELAEVADEDESPQVCPPSSTAIATELSRRRRTWAERRRPSHSANGDDGVGDADNTDSLSTLLPSLKSIAETKCANLLV